MVRDRLSSLMNRTVDGVRRAMTPDDEVTREELNRLIHRFDRLSARLDDVEGRLAEVTTTEETPEAQADATPSALDKLEKRLSMAMGAIQASTAQLMQVKEGVATAQNQAQQAMQRATTAQTTAEAAADGATAAEAQIVTLLDQITRPQEE